MIWRIRDKATFQRLHRHGRRVRRGPITVTWVDGASDEPPRVAYAIGKRVGGAVVRNRLRRRLRAIFAELGSQVVPGAYLVAAAPEAATLPYGELRNLVSDALTTVPSAASAPRSVAQAQA